MNLKNYNDTFFKYLNSGSSKSAELIIPLILDQLSIQSVLDVGCGQGAWLSIWQKYGVKNIFGIDGNYVTNLLIDEQYFLPHNLDNAFDLETKFDLVQCLEVVEHLPKDRSRIVIESLIRHGDVVLFSAATKGQGGDNHINEQSYEYWRSIFSEYDYVPIDSIRPLIRNLNGIEPWYSYNIILYVSKDYLSNLPQSIKDCIVLEGQKIIDISPVWYRVRKLLIRMLPISFVTLLAKFKEKIVYTKRT